MSKLVKEPKGSLLPEWKAKPHSDAKAYSRYTREERDHMLNCAFEPGFNADDIERNACFKSGMFRRRKGIKRQLDRYRLWDKGRDTHINSYRPTSVRRQRKGAPVVGFERMVIHAHHRDGVELILTARICQRPLFEMQDIISQVLGMKCRCAVKGLLE